MQSLKHEITQSPVDSHGEEEQPTKFRESYQTLIDIMPDPLVVVDGKGKFLAVNATVEEITGFKKEELLGKSFLKTEIVTTKSKAILIKNLAKRMLGVHVNPYEIEVRSKDRRKIPFEVNAKKIEFAGTPADLVIFRDIAERRRLEDKLKQYAEHLEELVQKRTEELLESETRYSVLVEEASDGVAILQDERIVFVNKRLLELSGYSKDELAGIAFGKIVSMVDEKYRQLIEERHERRVRGEEVPATSEVELITKTGERIPVETNSALIHHRGHPAVFTIVRDIRERKRMEAERLRLEKLATIGELATMVGHDLRNPLQSIENAAYYLDKQLSRHPSFPQVPRTAIEMLQVITNSINYADKIIRDLEDFSATRKPVLLEVNINEIVKEVLSIAEMPENVDLVMELKAPQELKVDKDMMKRVFMNLTLNGVQAMSGKGGKLTVSTEKVKGFLEIRFKDTGVGIPKDNLDKIFTPLFTTKAKGMGMGLSICKKFVELHDGIIKVESDEGKGSTFTVRLPIQQE